MKVLFLNLPFFDLRYQVHKEMGGGVGFKNLKASINSKNKIYPIVDLINAATIVNKKFDASLIDSQFFNFKNSDDYINYIIKNFGENVDYFFIRTSLPTIKSDNELTEKIKKKFNNSKFFVFGPALMSKDVIKYFEKKSVFDGIISSEIEAVIEDLLNCESSNDYPSGIYYKKRMKYLFNSDKRLFANMETIPFPDYGLLDYKILDRFIIQTQRGCPMACNYCPYYVSQGLKFRSHEAKKMVAQFKYLKKNFNAKKILIHDPIFTLDIKRVNDFCDLLINEKIEIEWECETHMKQIDTKLLTKMRKAGNITMSFGVESANKKVLEKANRRFRDWEKVKENIEHCKSIGIHTRAYFVLALEGDDVAGIYETIKLAKYLHPNAAQFSLPNLYPGTGAYQIAVDKGMIKIDQNYDSFIESLGNHSDKKTRPLSKKLNEKQAYYLRIIANHSIIILNSNWVKKTISYLKILIYKFLVQFHSIKLKKV